VLISGGGRCNITHQCDDVRTFVRAYPRGGKDLLSSLYAFSPSNTLDWFRERGLDFYTDEEGCVFPITDRSESVIEVLLKEAERLGVRVWTQAGVTELEAISPGDFTLMLSNGDQVKASQVLWATGGSRAGLKILGKAGVPIQSPVPALFPFKISDSWLKELAGISINDCRLSLAGSKISERGTVLITHRGVSGPAVIRLSSWGARWLQASDYRAALMFDWLPAVRTEQDSLVMLNRWKEQNGAKQTSSASPFVELPVRLWRTLCGRAEVADQRWADLSKAQLRSLNGILRACEVQVVGRDASQQEYVTCGGVALEVVDTRRFESRQYPGLFFAGEVLDIDGLTGGYNLQNCWTTGWVAGSSLAEYKSSPAA
jgi:predicted Rossmann fold flavoprotein